MLLVPLQINLLTKAEKNWLITIGLLLYLIGSYYDNFQLFVVGLAAIFAKTYSHEYSHSSLNALAIGELRDRIYSLADRAKVKLEQVYILKEENKEVINAYATVDNKIILTDFLLKSLTKRQIDTIVAHELGHLKHQHLQTSIKISSAICFCHFLILVWIGSYFQLSIFRVFLFVVINLIISYLSSRLLGYYSRGFEYVADREAVKITGDARAYIQALDRITPLKNKNKKLLTHPPTCKRIDAIAKKNKISQKEVLEIIKNTNNEPVYYSLPANLFNSKRIFSTSFKAKIIIRRSRAIAAMKICLPIAIAGIINLLNLSSIFYLVGAIFIFAIFFKSYKWIYNWGENYLRQKIKLKFKKQGYSIDKYEAIFVGFAPNSQPRLYEKLPNWDMGYLFITRDRLCYVGEETCFSLSRKQIKAIELGKGFPSWYNYRRVYISWYENFTNRINTYNFTTANTYSLEKKLQNWFKLDANSKISPYLSCDRILGKLSTPKITTVTSNYLTNEFKINKLLLQLILFPLVTVAIAFIFNLSFLMIFQIILFAFLTTILETIIY